MNNNTVEVKSSEDLGSFAEDLGEATGDIGATLDDEQNIKEIQEKQKATSEVHKKKNAGVTSSQFSSTTSPTASIKNQFEKYPESVIFDRVETVILDLSNSEDLKTLNKITTKSIDPDNGIRIMDQDRKFSEKSDNWKVYMVVGYYKFKKLK